MKMKNPIGLTLYLTLHMSASGQLYRSFIGDQAHCVNSLQKVCSQSIAAHFTQIMYLCH
ncbi:hypothetical protein GCM10009409_36580 [Shewanella saliphila]|uniref:Uncharacterized protein n=1 Tax=Shewanella saliphila TaxID=2282698 RepID=A0ABQ2QAA3_9GAMM|nr:hypothetical protein GCM10009409_36580 [Shewanella saliphila]